MCVIMCMCACACACSYACSCVCVCGSEDLPGALGDGAQGHGLFDLGQGEHGGQAGQRGQPGAAQVVVAEAAVGLLAA